jgi:hypothetical protein
VQQASNRRSAQFSRRGAGPSGLYCRFTTDAPGQLHHTRGIALGNGKSQGADDRLGARHSRGLPSVGADDEAVSAWAQTAPTTTAKNSALRHGIRIIGPPLSTPLNINRRSAFAPRASGWQRPKYEGTLMGAGELGSLWRRRKRLCDATAATQVGRRLRGRDQRPPRTPRSEAASVSTSRGSPLLEEQQHAMSCPLALKGPRSPQPSVPGGSRRHPLHRK